MTKYYRIGSRAHASVACCALSLALSACASAPAVEPPQTAAEKPAPKVEVPKAPTIDSFEQFYGQSLATCDADLKASKQHDWEFYLAGQARMYETFREWLHEQCFYQGCKLSIPSRNAFMDDINKDVATPEVAAQGQE